MTRSKPTSDKQNGAKPMAYKKMRIASRES